MNNKFFWSVLMLVSAMFFSVGARGQGVDATIDLARFKLTDSTGFAELYITIHGNSVVYQKQKGSAFQAAVSLNLQVNNAAGPVFYEKLLLRSPIVADTAGNKPAFTLQKRIPLKNGSYTLHLSAADNNKKQDPTTLEIPVEINFASASVQISDIQLLESYEKTAEYNDYTKSGFKLVSYVAAFYPKELNTLKFYTEVYNIEKVAGVGEPVLLFYRIHQAGRNVAMGGSYSKQTAAPVNVLLAETDISQLGSGNYELIIDIRNKENKSLAVQKKFFQRSNPAIAANPEPREKDIDLSLTFAGKIDSAQLSYYLLSHLPLANTAEAASLKSLANSGTAQQQRNYLLAFWRRRSESDYENLWKEYQARIEYATNTFGNKTFKAYETDQGRVYLMHGPPNHIQTERNDPNRPVSNSDSRPYQIWQYYKIKNQSNRIFVFTQGNLGNSYNLIHSDAIGEVRNPNWRREVNQRFSGKDKFDRNSFRNDD